MTKLEDGRLTYLVLLELLDPNLVKMQFQISSMRVVGDPVMYFNRYPGRFASMHCQGVDLNALMPSPGERSRARQPGLEEDLRRRQNRWPHQLFRRAVLDLTVKSVAYLKTPDV